MTREELKKKRKQIAEEKGYKNWEAGTMIDMEKVKLEYPSRSKEPINTQTVEQKSLQINRKIQDFVNSIKNNITNNFNRYSSTNNKATNPFQINQNENQISQKGAPKDLFTEVINRYKESNNKVFKTPEEFAEENRKKFNGRNMFANTPEKWEERKQTDSINKANSLLQAKTHEKENTEIETAKSSDKEEYGFAEQYNGEQGNIDLNHRKIFKNDNGLISTENAIITKDITEDGKTKFVVIPTVIEGNQVSDEEAIKIYNETGKNLGKFDNEEDTNKYIEALKTRQSRFYLKEQDTYLKETLQARQKAIEDSKWYRNFTKESKADENKAKIYADGYQAGDISRILIQDAIGAGATVADLALHAVDAFESTGLNLASIIMSGVADFEDFIGLEERAERWRKSIAETQTLSSTGYNAVDPYSHSGRTTDSIVQGVAYSTEMALFSWALGGTEAVSKVEKLLSKIPTTLEIAGFKMPLLTILSSTGGALKEGYSKEDYNKALVKINALGEGLIDGFTESIFDTLGVGGSPISDKLKGSVMSHVEKGLAKAVTRVGFNTIGEGAEEILGYFLNWGLHNGIAILDKTVFNGDGKNWEEKFNSDEMWETFFISAISALISEGTTAFAGATVETSREIANLEVALGRDLTLKEQQIIGQKVLLNRELNYQHNYMSEYVNNLIDSSDITQDQKDTIKTIFDMSFYNETSGVGLLNQNTGMTYDDVISKISSTESWNARYNKYKLGNSQITTIQNSNLNEEAKQKAQQTASEKNYTPTQVKKSVAQMERYDKNLSKDRLLEKQQKSNETQQTTIENKPLLENKQQITQEDNKMPQNETSQELDTNDKNVTENIERNEENVKKTIENAEYIPQVEKDSLLEELENISTEELELFADFIKQENEVYKQIDDEILDTNKTYNTGRKETYDKYMSFKNEYDTTIFDIAKSAVMGSKRAGGRRTKAQWLQVARVLGQQISTKSNIEIEEIAYRTWQDERPNYKSNLNREGQNFVKFTSDEWINEIYNAVKKARENQTKKAPIENKVETQKETQVEVKNTDNNTETEIKQLLDKNKINSEEDLDNNIKQEEKYLRDMQQLLPLTPKNEKAELLKDIQNTQNELNNLKEIQEQITSLKEDTKTNQEVEVETNKTELLQGDNDVSVQRITVAPFYERQITPENKESTLKEVDKFYKNSVTKIAKMFGVTPTNIITNIGGFTYSKGAKAGQITTELSYTFDLGNIDSNTSDLIASLVGDLALEQQEAVISANYLDVNATNEDAFQIEIPVTDTDGVVDILHKLNINDFTIDETNGKIILLEFDNAIQQETIDILDKLTIELGGKKNGEIRWQKISSRYLDSRARENLYKEWLGKTSRSKQNGKLYNSVTEAQRKVRELIEKENTAQQNSQNEGSLNLPEKAELPNNTNNDFSNTTIEEDVQAFREETDNILTNKEKNTTPKENIENIGEEGKYGLGTKEVRHEETTLRSDFVSDEFKAQLKKEGLDAYSVLSNDYEVEQATSKLQNAGTDENGNFDLDRALDVEYKNLMKKFNDNARIDAIDVAMAETLIQQYSYKGDVQKALDVETSLATLASEYGQAIQALRLVNRTTPLGQAMYMEKVARKMAQKTNSNIVLSEKAKEDIAKAKPDSQELQQAIERAELEIANQMPPTFFEKLDNWRYLAMLGNPTTHIRNLGGNSGMHAIQYVKNQINGLIQDIYYKGKQDVTKTNSFLKRADKGQKTFAKIDAETMIDITNTGSKYSKKSNEIIKDSRNASTESIENKRRDFDNDFLNKYSKTNTWLLDVEDKVFMKWAYESAMSNYLSANNLYSLDGTGSETTGLLSKEDRQNYLGIKDTIYELENREVVHEDEIKKLKKQLKELENKADKNLKEAREWTTQEALEATFHQFNALANALNSFVQKSLDSDIKGISKTVSASKIITDAIVPYKKTPLNIVSTAVEYSPLGLALSTGTTINNIVNRSKQIEQMYNNKNTLLANDLVDNKISKNKYDKQIEANNNLKNRELAKMVNKNLNQLSKGLTGTFGYLLGMALASGGFIKLKGGNSGEDDEFEETALGKQEYSLIIGDEVSIPIDFLAPSTIPLIAGANFKQTISKNTELGTLEKLSAIPESVLQSVSDPVVDLSMLQGLQSSISSFGEAWKNDHPSEAFQNFAVEAGFSYLSQYIPSVVAKTAKTIDPIYRDTSSTKQGIVGSAERFGKQTLSKLPFASMLLQSRKDWKGEEQSRDYSYITSKMIEGAGDSKIKQFGAKLSGRMLENFILPSNITEVKEDEVAETLLEIYRETGDSTLLRNAQTVGKNIRIDNENYRYTNEEYNKAKEQYGNLLYSELDKLVNSDNFDNLESVEEKSKAINSAQSYAYNSLLESYAKDHNIEYKTPRSMETIRAIEDSGGSTSSYYEYIAGTNELEKSYEKEEYLLNMDISDEDKRAIYNNTITNSEKLPEKIKDIDINDYLEYHSQQNKLLDTKEEGEGIKEYEKLELLLKNNYDNDTLDKLYSNIVKSEGDTNWNNIKLISKGNTSDIRAYLQYKIDSSTNKDLQGIKKQTDKIKADGTVVETTEQGTVKEAIGKYLRNSELSNIQKLYIWGTSYKLTREEKEELENYINKAGLTVKQKQQILGKIKGVTLYKDNTYSWETAK